MMLQKIFKKIVDEIRLLKDLGLRDGKMSMILFLYYYTRIDPEVKDQVNVIFKDFLDDFKSRFRQNYSFEKGCSGIIWAIELLNENYFINADTNSLFANVDNSMRSYMATFPVPIYPDDFPFSPGLYFLKRFKHEQSISDYNKQIALIYLIDHAGWILESESYKKIGITKLSGKEMNVLIYFLKKVEELSIYPYKVDRLLSNMKIYIEKADYTNLLDSLVLSNFIADYSIENDSFKCSALELLYEASWQSLIFESPNMFHLIMDKLNFSISDVYDLFDECFDLLPITHWATIGLQLINKLDSCCYERK